MSDIRFHRADLGHAAQLAYIMREDDRREVWASSKATPGDALELSLKLTPYPWAVTVDDKVACMFGIAEQTVLSTKGTPWLLGSDVMDKYAIRLARGSRKYILAAREKYAILENYVDARNKGAIKLIYWLGFDLHEAELLGHEQLPFHKFTMVRN